MEDINLRMLLIKIGISSNLKGFYYILDAVNFVKKQRIHTNMTTVYEILSKRYNTNPSAVERGIRHAITKSHKNSDIIKNIYGIIPDNSAFIYDLALNFDIFEEIIKERI